MYKYYNYINDLGELKLFILSEFTNNNGEYYFQIWSKRTGDFCGSGFITEEAIKDFFNHYKPTIDTDFEI